MSKPNLWKIGYAQTEITPKMGKAFMAGFGAERSAIGTRAPLIAQAMSITDKSGRTALLICADVITFDPTTVEYLRRRLREIHGFPPEAIILAPSHTHWGPGITFQMNMAVGAPNPWYIDRLEAALLKLAGEAIHSATAASVSYSSFETQIGHNRRMPDPETGKIRWGVNVSGYYDRHTPVLMIRRTGRPGRIVLISHACHPTSSGNELKYSPDYIGGWRDEIQRELGPTTTGMFMMGCGADAKVTHFDQKTKKQVFTADPVRSKAAGKFLARATLDCMKNDMQELSPHLAFTRATGNLKFERPLAQKTIESLAYPSNGDAQTNWWARQQIHFPDKRIALTYEVQAWQLGRHLTLVGLEGEVCSPLAPLVRKLIKTPEGMLAAYINRAAGYIPTNQIRREGAYEGDTSHMAYFLPAPFTTKVEQEFLGIVKKALNQLSD